MKKHRIQITVVNPGLEGTVNALGALGLDFEDQAVYNIAMQTIQMHQSQHRDAVFLSNEKGETISWQTKYYHSMWSGPYDEWTPPSWLLPAEGNPPSPDS